MLDFTKSYLKDKVKAIVAVSGGADSMALLDMLSKTPLELTVCHVNYHKRNTSKRDEEIVINYCQKHNLNLRLYDAKNKSEGNFQDWARRVRYQFFHDIYEEIGADYLFVAHQQDDLIETYLFKKMRNSVGNHLGICECEEIFGMNVVRPLLNISKQELREYCASRGIDFGDDETNFSPIYTRNKLRLEVVNKMSPKERADLLDEIREEEKKWQQKRREAKAAIKDGSVSYQEFSKLPLDIKSLVLYELIMDKIPSIYPHLSKKRLNELVDQLSSSKPNVRIELKDDYYLTKAYDKITISKEKETYSYQLDELKVLDTPEFKIRLTGEKKMDGISVIDSDFPLTIRTYQKDDFIILKEGRKSVNRLFIDKKIPLDERKSWPIIVNKAGQIIFIPGLYRLYARKYWQNNLYVLKCYNCDTEGK